MAETKIIAPHAKAMKTVEGMEEETRLAYVAMTRAMSLLYLTYARSRVVGEEVKEHSPSRFLASIPKHLTKVVLRQAQDRSSATERGAMTHETIGATVLPLELQTTVLALPMVEARS